MPTMNHHLYDPRFLMLPVSPARSTDSQQDASCHSKHSTSHSSSAEDFLITESRILSSTSSSLDAREPCTPIIFRPTGWLTSPSLASSVSSPDKGGAPPLESFWMIQRSYAFDEDDDDDDNDASL